MTNAIERRDVVDETVDVVVGEDAGTGAAARLGAQHRVGQQLADSARQRAGVAERGGAAGLVAADHVDDAADGGADAGDARGHRFDQRHGRAFIARGQQEDVGGRVDRREIAPPAEHAHPIGDAERRAIGLEVVLELAAAGNQRDRAGVALQHARERIEDQAVLLDCGQAADRRNHGHAGRQIEGATRVAASAIVHGRKRRKVEAERHDAVLRLIADAIGGQQLVANRRRDRDDAIADARQQALERDEHVGGQRAEITVEHVAVIRVHDTGAWRRSARQVVRPGGGAGQHAGFRHVGVDDGGLQGAEVTIQAHQRAQVVERRQRSAQGVEVARVGAGRHEVAHVALAVSKTAVEQRGRQSVRLERAGQSRGLDRRSADVQPRDYARDADRLASCLGHHRRGDHSIIR
jgi:hypothetical protein